MSDSEKDPLRDLLSEFALGPAWARAGGDKQQERKPKPGGPTGGDRPQQRRDFQERGPGGPPRRPPQGRGGNYDDRRSSPPPREEAPPAEGVRATLVPDAAAVHLIGKEVHQVARVYPLFDVAQILLAERSRCRVIFEAENGRPPLIAGKLDESVFLTREEAVRHLWNSPLRAELLEEETIEVDPPTGNFQSVARCGLSGEWLGPPNFHSYQHNLRRLHRERYPHMPFEAYAAKVRTERGEEAVNAWLESTKQKTRWRLKDAPEAAWMDDRNEVERAIAQQCFDQAFRETRKIELSAAIPAKNLSPSLLTTLRIAGNHARKHPAILIPAVCRALEAEHLPVFKRQGKLHTGPARPHALAADAVLAERPGIMVSWIRANPPAKLEGLWKAVLPEGSTAPPAEFAADLFWLLQQGHILLFTDDTLVVQEQREPAPAKTPATPKPPKEKKGASPAQTRVPAAETTSSAQSADQEIAEAATVTSEPNPDTIGPDQDPSPSSQTPAPATATPSEDPPQPAAAEPGERPDPAIPPTETLPSQQPQVDEPEPEQPLPEQRLPEQPLPNYPLPEQSEAEPPAPEQEQRPPLEPEPPRDAPETSPSAPSSADTPPPPGEPPADEAK